MIIVTGGAGFIGSRIIKRLNEKKDKNILLVDDLSDASKLANIKDLEFRDYADKDDFIEMFEVLGDLGVISGVYHMGAESSTTCSDGKYLMKNNYQYTCHIVDICAKYKIPLVYASSAAVYGDSTIFDSDWDNYEPNNMYGFSKLQADRYVRTLLEENKIVGLRFFNVYSDGEFETHKEGMKSPAAWMKEQNDSTGRVKLFEGSDKFKRDFIHVNNVVDKCIELQSTDVRGIFNMGTGVARSFLDIAKTIVDSDDDIDYIKMPDDVRKGYQEFTQADMTNFPLNTIKLQSVKEGKKRFSDILAKDKDLGIVHG